MLRAKARKFLNGETRFRDRLLTSTDRLGKLATIPVVVQIVNKANTTPLARKAMEKMLGVHAERRLPPYAAKPFAELAPLTVGWPVKAGRRSPGKVAIFSTCYVNYNEPDIGLDLLRILDHNEIPYVIVEQASCCGMPKFELGDLESVLKLKNASAPRLATLVRAGYATTAAAYRAEVTGEFRGIVPPVTVTLHARASGLDVLRFYGFGNETPNTSSTNFYKVKQEQYVLSPALQFTLSQGAELSVGAAEESITCPHGRPTRLLVEWQELTRHFRRNY